MLLLIDSGNTRVKWALVDASQPSDSMQDAHHTGWLAYGAVLQSQRHSLAKVWSELTVTGVTIANVAGADIEHDLAEMIQAACKLNAAQVDWFASVASAAGVHNGYREPTQLGCDRFAALIGARAVYPAQRLIIATCGTATTVDALEADGHFLGGLILPGLGLMAGALAQKTAQLPQIGDTFIAPPLFADHTEAAIRSGCLAAQCGAIVRALDAHAGARCILSGGAASFVATMIGRPHHVIDNLVLRGLQASTWAAASC